MKSKKRLLSIVALLAVGAAVLGGCSGGSGASSGSAANSGTESSIESSEEMSAVESNQEAQAPSRPDTKKVSEIDDSYKERLLQYKEPGPGAVIAVMKTSMGDIRIQLFPEQAPKAVENFVTHAKENYYNGMIFHRVINDFMIQSGDPGGTGTGGESVFKDASGNHTVFEDEFSQEIFNVRGALSMANPGVPNYNQSQFFIVQNVQITVPQEYLAQSGYGPDEMDQYIFDALTQGGYPEDAVTAYAKNGGTPGLDFVHTIFGQVIEGMDVVDKIAATKTDAYVGADGTMTDEPFRSGEQGIVDKPLEDVVILSVTIEEAAG